MPSDNSESNQPITVQAEMEAGSSAVGLAESIKNELEEIITVPNQHKVLRVPDRIKKLNPSAYKPLLISIGPVFHGQSEFQSMEAFKKRYAKSFIEKYDLKIQDLIDIAKNREGRARVLYGMESSEISSDELSKIMVIDGAFLVEFLLRYYESTYEEIDRMTLTKWNTFARDLFLLENQIPYTYLDNFFLLAKRSGKWFIDDLHILDVPFNLFVDEAVLPQFIAGLSRSVYSFAKVTCFVDFLTLKMNYKVYERRPSKTSSSMSCPTISQLHRAGIKFRASPASRDWQWDVRMPRQQSDDPIKRPPATTVVSLKHGILEIPRFKINESFEVYFVNLLAMEQIEGHGHYATDYIALLDYLIDGPEDVQILVENDILQNFLDDDKAASDFINEIGRSIDMHPDFLYSDLVENLNAHCKQAWIKWKSTYLFDWKRDLKRNYFSNPWKTLSVIAAIILLGLTVIQTVCSLLGLN